MAARGCFAERLFSTDFVKYNRESDYFSGLIVLGSHAVTAYNTPTQGTLRFSTFRWCDQQNIVFTRCAKGLRFDLAELVADSGGFLEL